MNSFLKPVMIQKCEFFIYDRKKQECMLLDYDMKEYIRSCKGIHGPTHPSLKTCSENEQKCMVRKRTKFSGKLIVLLMC